MLRSESSRSSDTEFRDKSDESIDASRFFSIAGGRIVKIEGTVVGDVSMADKAELED